MVPSAAGLGCLGVILDPTQDTAFDVGLPVLAGEPTEAIFRFVRRCGNSGSFTLSRGEDWVVGGAALPVADNLEKVSHQLYCELLQATAGLHIARIWNYVPAINDSGPQGLENYRLFCKGRSEAFEAHHGPKFQESLPSASAVGSHRGALSVIFAAGPRPHRHIENPLQVPAYNYPIEYGPRAPSFARATVVDQDTHATVFISGTAAIRGHATVAPKSTLDQLDCTLENLKEISHACGIGSDLGAGQAERRHFKVYLRRPEDLAAVTAVLDERLFRKGGAASYLNADICRKALNVEIEATLWRVPRV